MHQPLWVWAWLAGLVVFILGGWLSHRRYRRRLPPAPPAPGGSSKVIVTMAALLLLSGCGAGQRAQVKGVGASVIDCAAPLLQSQIGGLLLRVSEILRGAPPDWASQLTALESGGVPALACAVGRTIRDLGSAPVAAAAASSLPTYDPGAAERGRLYLAQRGLIVKGEAEAGEQRGRDAIPQ